MLVTEGVVVSYKVLYIIESLTDQGFRQHQTRAVLPTMKRSSSPNNVNIQNQGVFGNRIPYHMSC